MLAAAAMGMAAVSLDAFCGECRFVESLVVDPEFRAGFTVLAATPGARVVRGAVQPLSATGEPAWSLAQWASRFDLSGATPEHLPGQGVRFRDGSKFVLIGDGADTGHLVLGMDSRVEYAGRARVSGQLWPHLLVQQDCREFHLFRTVERIELGLDARLLWNRPERSEGYDPGLHTAQFPLTFIVQDRDTGSEGYGDFLWFNVLLYDERWEFPDLYAAVDTADPSAKMIYAPPSRAFAEETLHGGGWVTFSCGNLLAHFREAISVARSRGFLERSPDPGAFAVSSVILGWEMTGSNDVAMQIRNLKLDVHGAQCGQNP